MSGGNNFRSCFLGTIHVCGGVENKLSPWIELNKQARLVDQKASRIHLFPPL